MQDGERSGPKRWGRYRGEIAVQTVPNPRPQQSANWVFSVDIQLLVGFDRLLHNHPSGDPAPSGADISMTREILDAAKALRIAVHDHLVVGRQGVASFKALGLM